MTCSQCKKETITAELSAYTGICEDCWAGDPQQGYGAASYWSGHMTERTAALTGNKPSQVKRQTPMKRTKR